MNLVLCFAAISLFCFFPLFFSAFHLNVGISLLLTLTVFLLLHLLFVFVLWIASLSIPKDKPIEKQNTVCLRAIGPASAMICFYGGVRSVITGMEKLPKDRRFLFVCNHRSMFDPFIVMDKLRDYNISFISKPSNMKIPFCGRIVYAAGFLAIDRKNDRNALKTILTASDYMKRDLCSIGIYPEGTRSRSGELLPFHAGSFKIAQRAKAPLVIASERDVDKCRSLSFLSPKTVCLDILEVLPAETVCTMRTDALAEHARALIQESLNRAETEV